jgi:hypothetical protein
LEKIMKTNIRLVLSSILDGGVGAVGPLGGSRCLR